MTAVGALGGARSVGLRALAAVVQATVGLASGGLAAERATGLAVVTDPVEVVVVFDRGVLGVQEDDLVPLLGAVLADPVAVEHAEVRERSRGALLCDALDVLAAPDAVDALSLRAPTGGESLLASGPLADGDASDDDALLGLVAELASAVESSGAVDADDRALVAPLLFSLPLQFRQLAVAGIAPGVPDVRVEASCHCVLLGRLVVQPVRRRPW